MIRGAEALPLHENLIRPFSRRQSINNCFKAVDNYRLYRAKRTTENVFGILYAYCLIFFQPILYLLKRQICSLHVHNILREAKIYAPN